MFIEDTRIDESTGEIHALQYNLTLLGIDETVGYWLTYMAQFPEGNRMIVNSIELSEEQSWKELEELVAEFVMDDVRKQLLPGAH